MVVARLLFWPPHGWAALGVLARGEGWGLVGQVSIRCALSRAQLYMGLINRNFPFLSPGS